MNTTFLIEGVFFQKLPSSKFVAVHHRSKIHQTSKAHDHHHLIKTTFSETASVTWLDGRAVNLEGTEIIRSRVRLPPVMSQIYTRMQKAGITDLVKSPFQSLHNQLGIGKKFFFSTPDKNMVMMKEARNSTPLLNFVQRKKK